MRKDHKKLIKTISICVATVLTGCATNRTVRQSAEFTNVKLGVLQGQLESHFTRAAQSIERQKLIVRDQFRTNQRLSTATSTVIDLAAEDDSSVSRAFNGLKEASDAVQKAEANALQAQRAYEESLEKITVGKGPSAESFIAVMTPLQTLAKKDSDRKEQLEFFAAYAKSVADAVKKLRDAEKTDKKPPDSSAPSQ